jgi:hypothetical protein
MELLIDHFSNANFPRPILVAQYCPLLLIATAWIRSKVSVKILS